jgi:hypothetical protein
MAIFDAASNVVLNIAKLLETVYDCSDVATLSMSTAAPNVLTVTTIDAFSCSKHVATVPIIVREMEQPEVNVTISIKKLAKSLKKTKSSAIRFVIVSSESLLVTPANNPDTTIYAEDNQYDFVVAPATDKKLTTATDEKSTTATDEKSVPITLLMADLATMVINLCIGSGFVTFSTKSSTRTLFINTKTPSNSVHVEKLLQSDVPDFESIVVIKLLKVLTHSSLPSIKTVVCHIPTEENVPLKFSVAFALAKCTLTTCLYDQTKYL